MLQSHQQQVQQQQQQQHREHRQEDRRNAPAAANGSSWRVTYLLQSTTGGWRKHKSPHIVSLEDDDHLCIKDQTTSRLQEHVSLGSVDALQAAFVAAADGQSIVRFSLAGQPVHKFALIADCGRSAAELCRALHRRGIKVGGMEDLPDTMYFRGSDQRSIEALEANIPNLSRPEVQAYIVRLLFQDSFHEFVHDLSEMFSHVQSNIPLPCTTPQASPSSTIVATGPPPPPAATATTLATAAPPVSAERAGSCSGPTTAATTAGPARNSLDEHGRPEVGSGGTADEIFGGGSSGSVRIALGDRDAQGSRAVRCEEGGGGVGGVSVGGRGRPRGVGRWGRGRGARGAKGGRGAGAGRGRGGQHTVASARTSVLTAEAQRGESGSAIGGCSGGEDLRHSTNSIETADNNKRRARPGSYTSAETPACQEMVSKRPRAREKKIFGGDRRVAATPQSPHDESLLSSTTRASKNSRPKRQQTAREPQRAVVVAATATATSAADGGGSSSPFSLSPRHGKGERQQLPPGRENAGDGDKRRQQRARRPPSPVGRGKTSPMMPSGRGAGVRGRRKQNSGVGATPTATRDAVSAAGGVRKPTREGQRGGGEGGSKPKGNHARGKKARIDGTASASACGMTPTARTEKGGQWKIGMPTPIGPPTPSGRMAGLTKTLLQMLGEVYRHRSGWAFCKGVDLEKAPGYLDVIKHPIDLRSMRERLKSETVHYTSKSMFYDDLVLMCRNGLLYNNKGTDYHSAAEDLLYFIQSKFGPDV